MRLISFALTTAQFRARTKTVTRRLGWADLKPGDLLMGCEKVMGRNGAPLVRLGAIVVISARREPLNMMLLAEQYGQRECVKEGFPEMNEYQFVTMFSEKMGCPQNEEVTRIEFRYLPGGMIE